MTKSIIYTPMQESIEKNGGPVGSFHEMMTTYEKDEESAMTTLSNFLARLWKDFNWGNIDNPQKKKKENIEREIFSDLANWFEYCTTDDSGEKELAMRISNAAQAVIDGKATVFIEQLCIIFWIRLGWDTLISGKSSYKEIDRDLRIIQPIKHWIQWWVQRIIQAKRDDVAEAIQNLPLLEVKTIEVKKEVPEWALNLVLHLTQLSEGFKELCKNLPLPVLENLEKFQATQKEIDFLRYRIDELNKKRDRYYALEEIVKATESRVANLRDNSTTEQRTNQRRERRIQSNEKRLQQKRDELFSIEIKKISPEIKKMEVRFRSLKKQLWSLFEKLQYTQGDLRWELEWRLNYRIPRHDITGWQTIDLRHLQGKTLWIITQISYELFPEWRDAREQLTRLEAEIRTGTVWEHNDWYISQNRAKRIMHSTLLWLYNKATSKVPKRRTYK